MTAPQIQLADGEELHFNSPDTFELPLYWDRVSVEPEGSVKLIFQPDPEDPSEMAERMWVRVISNDDGEYVGELTNLPLTLPLEPGVEVRFNAKHIIDIAE